VTTRAINTPTPAVHVTATAALHSTVAVAESLLWLTRGGLSLECWCGSRCLSPVCWLPRPDGGYLPRPKSSAGWFASAVRKAKIQTITPHDLRYTCASLAVSAGVNVLALQRMLGHTSATVTLDTYADLFDDDLDAVAVTLHSRYSRESVSKMCPRGSAEAQ
jgi:Phage integrase family